MDEVAATRTRRTWPVVIVLVLAVVAIVAIAVWGYRETTARSAAISQLAEATERLEAADVVVIEVDEIVRATVEPSLGEKALAAKDKLEGAGGDLSSAIQLIDDSREDLPEEELDRADALEASAVARQAMLEHAAVIIDVNIAAAAALGDAETGWDLVLEAEKLADTAVVEYNKLTKDAVRVSQDLSTQAERKLQEAKVKLESAQSAFPQAALAVFVKYVDDKVALLALSKKADEAFIAGKNEQANEFSKQHNEKDKLLVEEAKKLPETPSKAISEAYDAQAGEASEAYFQARAEATEADAELRAIAER